jgi:uncharacterized membrane protein YjfL (UPF0719 family)
MGSISVLLENILHGLPFIGLYALLFLLAKWAKDLFTSYSINAELADKDNIAVAMTMSGYYLGMTIIFVALLSGTTIGLKNDLMAVGGYSVAGIALLNLSRWINDRFILKTFCNIEKLTKEHDIGVGSVQLAAYLATGCIAAGAVSGEGNLLSFVAFFLLGQLTLVLFSIIYNVITPYDIHQELANKNTAAALGFSGALIGLGLIIMNGVSGDFVDWGQDLLSFAITVAIAFVFLPILLILIDRLVIPGKSMRKEIQFDKNLGAGLLEAVCAISFSAVLIHLL